MRTRRHYLRKSGIAGDEDCTIEHENLRAVEKALRAAIANSQGIFWSALWEDIDNNVWDEGYRIARRKLGTNGTITVMPRDRAVAVVITLFPTHKNINWLTLSVPKDEVRPFTQKLPATFERLKNGDLQAQMELQQKIIEGLQKSSMIYIWAP